MNPYHFALVVGIGRYPGVSDLAGPGGDAERMQEWLVDKDGGGVPEDNVTCLVSPDGPLDPDTATPTVRGITLALIEITRRARLLIDDDAARRADSRLYVYLAGHGLLPGGGVAALLTADARPEAPFCVDIGKIRWWYERSGLFREVVLLADCCRLFRPTVEPASPFTEVPVPTGEQVVTMTGLAARPSHPAYEGERRGHFTRAVLDGLSGLAPLDPEYGRITSTTLAAYVRAAVRRDTEDLRFPQRVEMPSDPANPILFGTAQRVVDVVLRFGERVDREIELLLPGGEREYHRMSGPTLELRLRPGRYAAKRYRTQARLFESWEEVPAMSSSDPATLTVRVVDRDDVPLAGAVVTLSDDRFATVPAAADGTYRDLRSGVYRAEARIGGACASALTLLRPGERGTVTLVVAPASAAAPGDAGPAVRLSGDVAAAPGPPSGLVVVLVGSARPNPATVEVLDADLDPVALPLTRRSARAVARGGRLGPGGYVLRLRTTDPDGSPVVVDQALWLAPDWQTLVFAPVDERGPDPAGQSVQMVALTDTWDPRSAAARRDEVVAAFLRDGTPAEPVLLHTAVRTGSPLAAAQAVHAAADEDRAALTAVVRVRFSAAPPLPDVAALLDAEGEPDWPPLLAPSYDLLLRAGGRAVLPGGGLAARIAPLARPSWPWLQWTAPDGVPAAVPEAARERVEAVLVAEVRAGRVALGHVRVGELAARARLPRSLVAAVLRDLLPVPAGAPTLSEPDEDWVGRERYDQISDAPLVLGDPWGPSTTAPLLRVRRGALLILAEEPTLTGRETTAEVSDDLVVIGVHTADV